MSTIPSTRGNPHASDIAVQTATPMLGGASREDLQTVVSNTDSEIAKLFEDRNITLTGGGLITYNAAGTSVSFSQALNLEINSQVAGGSPTVVQIVAAAGSKTISADGRMIYAVVNRLAGTAVVTDDSATLSVVTSANQEVFLIAKRRDATGPIPKLYFRNGFVLAANQAAELGQPESFIDSEFFVSDATDTTIKFKVDAAGTTGTSTTLQTSQTTNKTLTLPDVTDTLVAKTTTDILSNKTLQTFKGAVVTDSTTTGADATLQAADITNVITRLTNGSLTSIGGIPAGGSGQIVIVENQTGVLVSIKDEDTVATAANRIRTGTGSTVQMPANSTFMFTYDSTAARWMLSGGSGSGSGSGEINVIGNPNDATNWVASGAGVTVATTTTGSDLPLGSVILTAIKITPVSGTDYVRYRWTMPTALKNRKLKTEWFQHPISGYAAGDFKVEVYKNSASDYTGSYTEFALNTDISGTSSIPALDGKYTTSFDSDTADYYELRIVRVAGTTALNVANVIVGPGIQPQGAVITPPQTLSVTYDNLGTVANSEVTYSRYGSRMKVQGRVTTGTVVAGTPAINLPSGFTLNTGSGGLSNQASGIMVGTGRVITSGASEVDAVPAVYAIYYDGSLTTKLFITERSQSSAFKKHNATDIFANGDIFVFDFDVPVAEFTGNGTVTLASNDVEYLTNTNTSTSANDTTSFGYSSGGTAFVAVSSAGATVKKRIRAQRPMDSNKGTPKLQVSPNGTNWVSAESQFLYTEAGAQRYGMRLTAGGTAATDIDVEFGGDGANGTEAWSTFTSWFWRVVIEQPGVAVGFGLADASSSGLMSSSAQTFSGAKTWNDIQTWKASSGATSTGSYDASGQWTLGATTGGALTHLVQSNATTTLKLFTNASGSTDVFLELFPANTGGQGKIRARAATDTGGTVVAQFEATQSDGSSALVNRPPFAWINGAAQIGKIDASSLWSIGPLAVAANYAGPAHKIFGGLQAGAVTSGSQSGQFPIGTNAYLNANISNNGRSQTAPGGALFIMDNSTVTTAEAFGFYTNQPGNSTTTPAVSIGSALLNGAWFLGTTNKKFQVSSVGGANNALIGNPSSQVASLPNSGTYTFQIGDPAGASGGPGGGIFIVNDTNGGSTALVLAGYNATVVIIAQTAAKFVVGAPATGQVGITFTNATASVTLTAGATAGVLNVGITAIGSYIK